MCYGSLDPKFMMQDTRERVKGVAFVAEKTEEPEIPDVGLMARLMGLVRRMKQKDVAHG